MFDFLSQETVCRQDEGRVILSSSVKFRTTLWSFRGGSAYIHLALWGQSWALQRLLARSYTKPVDPFLE